MINLPKPKGFDTEPISKLQSFSPEEREQEMIELAMRCAEQQLRDGTASPAVVVHFLKRTDPEERKKLEKMEKEIALLQAKIESYESSKRLEDLYANAINALRSYTSGSGVE